MGPAILPDQKGFLRGLGYSLGGVLSGMRREIS